MNKSDILKAVDNVSFNIYRKETLGIIGESGCGKTTLGRTILGLYNATSGNVLFDSLDVHKANKKERKNFKKRAQIILQDPYASLNPRMAVGDIIAEGIDAQNLYNSGERMDSIYKLLSLVGLNQEHASRFPHEFSGGQRQRIGIARALAVEPEFIVCDEPISALDVSIQAQIVNLLMGLQDKLGLTYLFIAHDLSMIQHISDKVGVMYLGKLVELAASEELCNNPLHPYTKALISAIPSIDLDNPINDRRIRMKGEIPSPINPKPVCRFAGRCICSKEICHKKEPEFKLVGKEHYVACHLVK